MEAEISWLKFDAAKKRKCDCCDLIRPVELKALLSRQGLLIGDLDLCGPCGEVVHQLLSVREPDLVEKEWNFLEGRDL
ncbi:MAG TPA: hypothetical protein GX711_01035 [Clostridia bacterium]|nr:hypothetical protein [Clostridia bacterium]